MSVVRCALTALAFLCLVARAAQSFEPIRVNGDGSWEQGNVIRDGMLSLQPSFHPLNRQTTDTMVFQRTTVMYRTVSNEEGESRPLLHEGSVDPALIPGRCDLVPAKGRDRMTDLELKSFDVALKLLDWEHTRDVILPQDHVTIDGHAVRFFFKALPFGMSLSFPVEVAMRCSEDIFALEEPLGERQSPPPLTITLLPSTPEVVVVSDSFQLMPSFTSPGKGAADRDESQLNANGIDIRLLLTKDNFFLDISQVCQEHFATTRGGGFSLSRPPPKDGGPCSLEYERAVLAVKSNIVNSFTCEPLPCLHANPFFAQSAYSAAFEAAKNVRDYKPLPWGSLDLRAASRVTSTASVAALIVPHGVDETSSPAQDIAKEWKSLAANGSIPMLLRPEDVTLYDSYAEVRVSASELKKRSFALPRLNHVAWWAQKHADSSQCGRATSSPGVEGCSLSAGGEDLVSDKKWSVPTRENWAALFTSGDDSAGDGIFSITFDPSQLPTVKGISSLFPVVRSKAQRFRVRSTDPSKLSLRGLDPNDLSNPFFGLRYEILHPSSDGGYRSLDESRGWVWTRDCIRGDNSSSTCPLELVIVAHALHSSGFRNRPPVGSTEEKLLRQQFAYLSCPPSPIPCEGYYGDSEIRIARYIQSEWISAFEFDGTLRKTIRVRCNKVSPASEGGQAVLAFPKDIFVAFSLPPFAAGDDGEMPIPSGADRFYLLTISPLEGEKVTVNDEL